MLSKETILEMYLSHSKESLAEMLYDTIARYESRTCENCKYCRFPLDIQITVSDGFCDKDYITVHSIRKISDFGCNKFERKEDKPNIT